MKIIVIGSTGLVGQEVSQEIGSQGYDIVPFRQDQLDITSLDAVQAAVLQNPDACFVVNAAGLPANNEAKHKTDTCYAVNRDGVANVALACQQAGIPLLHISSSYVFDGTKEGTYDENDSASPQEVFGDSKWQGEQAIREVLPQHLILRSSCIFGNRPTGFVQQTAKSLLSKQELVFQDDLQICPTAASDIARVAVGMMEQANCTSTLWGTYHYSGKGAVSRHQLAQIIANKLASHIEHDPEKRQARYDELSSLIRMHYKSGDHRHYVMSCKKIRSTFGVVQRDWQVALPSVLTPLLDEAVK